MQQGSQTGQDKRLTDNASTQIRSTKTESDHNDFVQGERLRRHRSRNRRQQVLKIGTVISVLALLIAWLGQDELPEQQIAIALPAKETPDTAAPSRPIAVKPAEPVAPPAPATTTIPVAPPQTKPAVEQAVPAIQPSTVANTAPAQVVATAGKDIQRINEQAIHLVNEGNPRQAINLLEKSLLEHKDAGPLFDNLRRLYAGFATQSYQLALEPGKAKPVTVELVKTSGEAVSVQIASLDMKARSASQALPEKTTNLPELPAKTVLSSETSTRLIPPVANAQSPAAEVQTAAATTTPIATTQPPVAVASITKPESPSVAVAKDPTTAEKAEANRSVMAAVKRWADAWSKQDPDAYIAMYAPTFKPKDMTRAQWEAYRRDRLTKPKSIRIELSDQKAIMLSAQKMRVTFTQQYMSDSLKTSDKKTLELELIDNQWRITLESGR